MKIKNILISQPEPSNTNPYSDLIKKYGLKIDFYRFFNVSPLSSKDFRLQKIALLDHTAVVFTSKMNIDSFFSICEHSRIVVPEIMKYFCTSESVALYLQKYIVYRKRKIFYGNGRPDSLISVIGTKHKNEKFLIATTDTPKSAVTKLFIKNKLNFTPAVLCKTVYSDLSMKNIHDYDILVFYSPTDVKSLLNNYPDYKQTNQLIATFGNMTAKEVKANNLKSSIVAPSPEAPSIAKALSIYFENNR
ncbi:MAG: uroporphyrinogen-III synthase [Bacteroidales bacterium]